MGECFLWKAHGQCSKGDSCSFSHDKLVHGDLYGCQRRKGRLSSPAPSSKAKTDEGRETSSKTSGNRGKLFRQQERNSVSVKKLSTPSCKFGHPPVCQNYKSETGSKFGRTCFFRHVEAEGKPSKKSKKGGGQGDGVPMARGSRTCVCANTFSLTVWHTQGEKGDLTSCRGTDLSTW